MVVLPGSYVGLRRNLVNSQLVPWWISEEVVKVLKKHAKYLIINRANEVGAYRWADNPNAALAEYETAYTTAIASIRKTGLAVPIMLDAPDRGTSIDAFLSVGQQLIDADPSVQHDADRWLAWSWGPDECSARRMSPDGSFASRSDYGKDIVAHRLRL